MKSLEFQSVVYKEGKYFVAQCLDVDLSSFGKTEKEALANLKEALELYLEDSTPSKDQMVENPKLKTLYPQNA
jgi:predicted RNase H-like HicB family nuclease